MDFQLRNTYLQLLNLPFIICVFLDKLLSHSEPFLTYNLGIIKINTNYNNTWN